MFSSVPGRFQAVLLMGRAGLPVCREIAGFGPVCLRGTSWVLRAAVEAVFCLKLPVFFLEIGKVFPVFHHFSGGLR